MGYCFLSISKINARQKASLVRKYEHNFRTTYVPNAIPEMKTQNQELIPLVDHNGKACTYLEAFNERIHKLPYYYDHEIRSNAVIAYEVVTTFSRGTDIDLEEWKKDNVKWLRETFDICPKEYGSNVLSVVFHGDECGNVHCHALIIPIDERGKLCARSFTNGRHRMQEIQDSYAKAMAHHGLERGLRGSSARHQDIKKYYCRLNNSLDIPKAYENEPAAEYRLRVLETLQTERAIMLKEFINKETDQKRNMDKLLQEERQLLTHAVYAKNIVVKANTEHMQKTLDETARLKTELKQETVELQIHIEKLRLEQEMLSSNTILQKELLEKAEKYDKILKVIQYAKEYYPKIANDIIHDYTLLSNELERTGISRD